MISVSIEFFGIPRQRAGVARCELQFEADPVTLETALSRLGERFPEFGQACVAAGRLKPGYTANLRGERFVSDPATMLCNGDELLILSADAGG